MGSVRYRVHSIIGNTIYGSNNLRTALKNAEKASGPTSGGYRVIQTGQNTKDVPEDRLLVAFVNYEATLLIPLMEFIKLLEE